MGFLGPVIAAVVGVAGSIATGIIGGKRAEEAAREAEARQREAEVEAQMRAYEHDIAVWREQASILESLRKEREAKAIDKQTSLSNVTTWIALGIAGAVAIIGIRLFMKG